MSLVDRLRKVQTAAPVTQVPDMTLEELENQVVDFGQKHKGKKYATVWDTDQEWISWFLSHYARSSKVSHQKFVMFAEKKISQLETTGTTVVKTACEATTSSSQFPVAPTFVKPKAKTKGYPVTKEAHPELPVPDSEEEFDMVDPSMTMYATQQLDVAVLQERMLHMENALTQIMQHIQNQN